MERNTVMSRIIGPAVVALGLALAAGPAFGANWYIRAGAAGSQSGADWTNALPDLPDSFVRGDVYYVADGVYGSHVFNTPESGSTNITIKKAIASDHGTSIGWDASYGDGVAHFTSGASAENIFWFTTGYWIVDGQVGGGPGSWESGHGIKISQTNTSTPGKLLILTNGPDHLEFRHMDMEQSGIFTGSCSDAIYAVDSSNGGADYVLLDHCYIHEVDRGHIGMNYTNNWTIEYSKLKNRITTATCHGEAISANFDGVANNIIRYSVFQDVAGTGYIVIKSGDESHWEIYGNLFYETQTWAGASNSTITDTSHPDTLSYIKVYNNTFVNMKMGVGFRPAQGTNNEAYNNLFYNCNGSFMFNENVTHDYNWFYNSGTNNEAHGQVCTGTCSDIFAGYGANDFRLARPTNAGLSLAPPYNVAMDGTLRAVDGVWDRGAYEYDGPVVGLPTPNPPSGISVR